MASELAIRLIDKQPWLESIAEVVQPAVAQALDSAGPEVANVLHGTWLGHPLHAVLTDVPVGAWTAAALFDVLEQSTGRRFYGRSADAAITIGLVGAVAAALTGLADWSKIGGGKARRIGLTHALLNVTATALYTKSLSLRRNHSRSAGRQLGLLGFLVANASAYLGGHLVYREKIGVDHTADARPPKDFVAVLADAELPSNQLRRVDAGGMPVLLVRKDGQIHAIAETCAHLGGPLSEGKLDGDAVICPWHGSRYSLADGRVLGGPSAHAQPVLEVRVRDGQIEVRAQRE
jgi:nitrite reductase/ring-hydroxylating ferredoxin subunit/uncharacterized membrane protein